VKLGAENGFSLEGLREFYYEREKLGNVPKAENNITGCKNIE
jgi:hypothetical protein